MDDGHLAVIPCEYYFRFLLTYEEMPQAQQLELARAEAERIIQGLGGGSWRIGRCEARQLFNGRYDIMIDVTHQVDGYPVDEAYTSTGNVCQEMYRFRFGKDGTLIYFSFINPYEKLGYISQDQKIIGFDPAMELAKSALLEGECLNFDQLYVTEKEIVHYGQRSDVAIDKVELCFEKRREADEDTF